MSPLLKSSPASADANGFTATFARGVPEMLNPKAKAKEARTKRRNFVSLKTSLSFHESRALKLPKQLHAVKKLPRAAIHILLRTHKHH